MIRVGIDVYIGYCPDRHCRPSARAARCNIGCVIAGPYPPLSKIPKSDAVIAKPSWTVAVDGQAYRIADYLLTPIDGNDEAATREAEVEA